VFHYRSLALKQANNGYDQFALLLLESAQQRKVALSDFGERGGGEEMPYGVALDPRLWLAIEPALIRRRTTKRHRNQQHRPNQPETMC
jgi:hypothetical protein